MPGIIGYIKKDLDYRFRKVIYLICKKLHKWHILPKMARDYANYQTWIQKPDVNKKIRELLLSNNSFVQKYITKESILNLLDNIDPYNTSKILSLCTVQIYFDMIGREIGKAAQTSVVAERE